MVTDGKFVGDDVQHIVGLDFISRLTPEQRFVIMVLDHHQDMYDAVQEWRSGKSDYGQIELVAKVALVVAQKLGMPDLFDERVVSEVGI